MTKISDKCSLERCVLRKKRGGFAKKRLFLWDHKRKLKKFGNAFGS